MAKIYKMKEWDRRELAYLDIMENTIFTAVRQGNVGDVWVFAYKDAEGQSRIDHFSMSRMAEHQLDYIKILKKTVYGKKV